MTKRKPKPSDPAKAQAFTGMLRAKFGKGQDIARAKVLGGLAADALRVKQGHPAPTHPLETIRRGFPIPVMVAGVVKGR